MVKNVPHVNVTHDYGFVSRVLGTDQTMACVIETKKGTPNVPVLISSPGQLRSEFGVTLDAYWAAGGGPFYAVRAAYGDVVAAEHYIYDNASTACKVAKVVSKRPGSTRVYLTFRSAGSGLAQRLSLTIEEENGLTEYFLNVKRSAVADSNNKYKSALQNLVEKVNSQSRLVEMFFQEVTAGSETSPCPVAPVWVKETDEAVFTGAASYTSIPRGLMGEGVGNVSGADGDGLKAEADRKPFDIISDIVLEVGTDAGSSPSEIAHTEALKSLEQLKIAGVFCLKAMEYDSRLDSAPTADIGDIYQVYVEHVTKMNTPEQHGWRFAIVGADDNMNMMERIKHAAALNNELMVFVAGGIVDVNAVEYEPRLATQAVAGKIANTKYNVAIWGGRSTKALVVGGRRFVTDILPIPGEPVYDDPDAVNPTIIGESPATRTEMITYNECGCLTFLLDNDGVKITEGVTTVQESYAELGIRKEDEIAVMRVINHAKFLVYDACYGMLGQLLTATFKSDLEEAVRSQLGVMQEEGALSAYDVSATVGPSIGGEQGQIMVDISITPVHAARIIDARIVVY